MEEVKDSPESPADCLEVATIEHKDVNDVGKVEDKDTSEETEKEGKPARKRHAYPRVGRYLLGFFLFVFCLFFFYQNNDEYCCPSFTGGANGV